VVEYRELLERLAAQLEPPAWPLYLKKIFEIDRESLEFG
jgi:hypothetical protein